ncbi:MAG: hypothetical protein K0R25_781 [Rickettsiaceae bacterium]|jgi:hypothetical protein|nr:hypothetical protein [Rickettsiaceae bacterium]
MTTQINKIEFQIDELAREFQKICENTKLTPEEAAKAMMQKADQLVGKIDSEIFKEYLKNELGLKNDADIKKFASSSLEEIKKKYN